MTAYHHDSPRLAAIYDRISNSQFAGGQRLVERLEIKEGDRVLDVGCGTGRLADFIRERVGQSGSVVGVDPLAERIAVARQRADGISFALGSAEDLSAFADQSFNVVCLNAVFHWIADKPKALAEIRRVLRPRGRLGCTTSPKELYGSGTMPTICASVLGSSPYVESLNPTALAVMTRHLATSEILNALAAQGLDLVELHLLRRTQLFQGGEDVVDFAEASSFGNFLSLVAAEHRGSARADLIAAFEKIRQPDGITLRSFGTLFVAERPTSNP
jgi:arsenite methyltransferase